VRLARVVGQVVSTVKETELSGLTLLLVRDLEAGDPDGEEEPRPQAYIAVDLAGAGDGEVVVVTTGSAARVGARTVHAPIDVAVVGIVDSVIVEGRPTFRKA
jgi:ethanolamine utilization protein EutN